MPPARGDDVPRGVTISHTETGGSPSPLQGGIGPGQELCDFPLGVISGYGKGPKHGTGCTSSSGCWSSSICLHLGGNPPMAVGLEGAQHLAVPGKGRIRPAGTCMGRPRGLPPCHDVRCRFPSLISIPGLGERGRQRPRLPLSFPDGCAAKDLQPEPLAGPVLQQALAPGILPARCSRPPCTEPRSQQSHPNPLRWHLGGRSPLRAPMGAGDSC